MSSPVSPPVATAPPDADRDGGVPPRRRGGALVAVVAVGLVAVGLRLVGLTAGLPELPAADEPFIADRALEVAGGELTPSRWDWPPLVFSVLGGAVRAASLAGAGIDQRAEVYVPGRYLFVGISLLLVAATGWLAAEALAGRRHRRAVAIGSAAVMAVSYLTVHGARSMHPEQLQALLAVGSLAVLLRYERTGRRPALLAAAGGLAGLAAATKYLGGIVAVPVALAVLTAPGMSWARRAGRAGLAGGAAVVGFVAATSGAALTDLGGLIDGLAFQLSHQTGGHLGYEAQGPGWLFHLTRSYPGTWGWPLTVLGLVGTAAALVWGGRRMRLVASAAVPVWLLASVSQVRFPHYIEITLPVVAVLGLTLVAALVADRSPRLGATAVAAVLVTLLPTVLHDVRLIRAELAPDTRMAALERIPDLRRMGPVVTEGFAPASTGADRDVSAAGNHPDLLDCDCILLLNSHKEGQFRRRPDLYAPYVAFYDRLRERGRTIEVIAPRRDLSYRWQLLPRHGLAGIPLTGPVGRVGPTLTVLDLRDTGR